jgi:hypothetical protein
MLSLSSMYFLVTGIQFWITEYLQEVLLMEKTTVFTYFSLISITAPILGVVIGKTKKIMIYFKINIILNFIKLFIIFKKNY